MATHRRTGWALDRVYVLVMGVIVVLTLVVAWGSGRAAHPTSGPVPTVTVTVTPGSGGTPAPAQS